MNETMINIVAVPGGARWLAVAPSGVTAGVLAMGPDPPLALGGRELSLRVEPRWRRQGVGSRLLAAVRDQTAEPRLLADVVPGTPGEAFCLRHGFRRTVARRHDLLTYCDVHGAWLGELVDAEHPGYRLTHWTGDVADASPVPVVPSGPGDTVLTAANTASDLAAYAMAVIDVGPRARLHGPAVLPTHDGPELGPWVGAALIQRVRQVHPHVNEIETVTAENDPYLLGDLGFQPIRRTRLYELALP
ncbi:GNAT family N-acetyltransferase [Asanoa ishikariensis]|nr:GNAT family N-acetyltransferase [Asanoa ishikariensis]